MPPPLSDLDKLLADQLEFQLTSIQDGPYPDLDAERRMSRMKEMILHLHSETDELLRAAGAWKFHRRITHQENKAAIGIELVDILKYWMIVVHLHGFTKDELLDAYWTKSMTVRQRYAEEWLKNLYEPSVVVDIDNVLADYIGGFLAWAAQDESWPICARARDLLAARPPYVGHTELGVTPQIYETIKHRYRTSNQHRYLPVMPGAKEFLESIQATGFQIILLTSRPIHQYPNLYGDTLHWLKLRELPYDFLWWAQNKAEEIVTRLPSNAVMYAVDDELQYIDQYRAKGIMAFHYIPFCWARPDNPFGVVNEEVGEVNDLRKIPDLVQKYGGPEYVVSRCRPSSARPTHGGNAPQRDQGSPVSSDRDA